MHVYCSVAQRYCLIKILKLIESDTLKIVPDFRRNEVLAFVKKGLEDISISRNNERAKNWGVPVPGDETQRMYVWFDALINYLITNFQLYKKVYLESNYH